VLKFPLLGTLIINLIIIVAAIILEEFLLKHRSETHSIVYEKLGLLKPDKKEKLLEDVSLLTGKAIVKVKIRRIDYKRKTALLDIYYRE
jgi:hypothetical protein